MKKEYKEYIYIIAAITTAIVLAMLSGGVFFIRKQNAGLRAELEATETNRPPTVLTTNALVAVQTNAPESQIDFLLSEVKALRAANEEREARVQRLLKLNEEVQRERAMVTNHITVPVNVTVTNSPPSVNINGTINVGGSTKTPVMARTAKMRVPMYVVTNSTSSVTTTGTNVSSVVNTQTQSFLKPQRRWSVMGLIFGEKDPISTTVPSGQSIQQGYPAPQVVVVEQPAYGYSYGHRYPYRYAPTYNQPCERRLFGVRFHTR